MGYCVKDVRQLSQHVNCTLGIELKSRQIECLSLHLFKLTKREIGKILNISENTVKFHLKAVLVNFDTSNTCLLDLMLQKNLFDTLIAYGSDLVTCHFDQSHAKNH